MLERIVLQPHNNSSIHKTNTFLYSASAMSAGNEQKLLNAAEVAQHFNKAFLQEQPEKSKKYASQLKAGSFSVQAYSMNLYSYEVRTV